jgi:putative ABC transport system substrate-binding protein
MSGKMKRRDFITLLGAAVVAWPLAARAAAHAASRVSQRRLARIGHTRLSRISRRLAGSRPRRRQECGEFDRLPGLAADLIGRRVAVIVTSTLPAALAAKAATTTIPIVFVIGEDPVEVGLVQTLNRPGGNVTGLSNFMNLLGAKRLELLAETVPNANALAVLVNQNNPNAPLYAINECILEEIRQPLSCAGALLRLVQLRENPQGP